jgi:DNA ligase (NAD+)
MDIGNLGPQRISQLLEHGLIHHFTDIFQLDPKDLALLPKMGEKSVENLLHSIEESRSRPLWRLLHGLGIPHVGAQTAKVLARKWPNLCLLAAASVEELCLCEGVGEIVARSIGKFFQNEANGDLIQRLEAVGVSITDGEDASQRSEGRFSGKSFVITGTFSTFSREKLAEEIERRGGKVRSSLSARTDGLLVGENPGSKVLEAQRLGIPPIGEWELLAWLQES